MDIPAELTIPQPPAPLGRTYWVVAGQLLDGAYPGKRDPNEHLARLTGLFESGMRTFVNLMEENESNNAGVPFVRYDDCIRDIASSQRATIAHLRFPIRDGGVTTTDRTQSILDSIDLSLEAGKPAYVHCFGGMGRTGTTICCWLLRHGLANKNNVLSVLTTLRHRNPPQAIRGFDRR
jgi:protein tyrosine phosphatase